MMHGFLAVVVSNECAGLGPGDWLFWAMGCWAMPFSVLLPVLALGAATLAATVRRQVAR